MSLLTSCERPENAAKVPESLRATPQWVCWRSDPPRTPDGKPVKVPVCPRTGGQARTNDPSTWGAFEEALALANENKLAGIGFIFTKDDDFVGIDLDECRDPETGELEDWAQGIVEKLASYTEVSPSEAGVHVIVRGELPSGGRRKDGIEMYDSGRYFTVTGQMLPGAVPEVMERQPEIDALHAGTFGSNPTMPYVDLAKPRPVIESDDELIKHASQAKDGGKFSALWSGDHSSYPSHSEADLALCSLLRSWTQGDESRVDRLFRQSGLMRTKWDEQRGEMTYGEKTISKAFEGQSKFVGSKATTSQTRPVAYIPGAHQGKDGYFEVGSDDFANLVLSSLPPHRLFVKGNAAGAVVGELVGPDGSRSFRALDVHRTRIVVDSDVDVRRWVVKRKDGDEESVELYVPCNRDHASLVLAGAVEHANVAELKTLASYPLYFGPECDLATAGYDPTGRCYYDEPEELRGLQPIRDPAAIREVLEDLVIDFPFADAASRENFFGLLLTPLMRAAIDGNVPLHAVDAPIERTGKSKLIEEIVGGVILGQPTPALQFSGNEDERDKRITALLLEGRTVVHMDNQGRALKSDALASLITSSVYQGRLLGVSKMPALPNTLVLVVSGNNIQANNEMAKRIVPIRLVPATDRPEERRDFRHPQLREYVRSVRVGVLEALLGMVMNWKDDGRPRSERRFGGFESWTATVGGVLEMHGFDQFLCNRTAWVGTADLHREELDLFVSEWATRHGSEPIKPSTVFGLVCQLEVFNETLAGCRDDQGRKIALGRFLTGLRDRVVGGWSIGSKGSGARRRYWLEPRVGGAE